MGGQNSVDSESFQIRIELRKSSFFPGDKVSGKIHMNVLKALKPSVLLLKFEGRELSQWQELFYEGITQKRKDLLPRTSQICSHGDQKKIIKKVLSVYEWTSEVPVGGHTFPFKYYIPKNLPGSIKFHRYCIHAEIQYNFHVSLSSYPEFHTALPLKISQFPFDTSKLPVDRPVTKIRNFCNRERGQCRLSVCHSKSEYDPREKIELYVEVNNTESLIGLKGFYWKMYHLIKVRHAAGRAFVNCEEVLAGKVNAKVAAGANLEGENAVLLTLDLSEKINEIKEVPMVKGSLVEAVYYIVVFSRVDTFFSCYSEGAQVMEYVSLTPVVDKEKEKTKFPENWNPIKYSSVKLEEERFNSEILSTDG